MTDSLQKVYSMSKKLFPGISGVCSRCDTCCRTYGWVLDEEAKRLSKEGCPMVTINNNIHCIDSFRRGAKKRIIIEQIPRCVYYKKGACLINRIKPLDCRLYPIKVKFEGKQAFIGLSLGCKYISFLSPAERDEIDKNVVNFFNEAPKAVINDYLDTMYEISLVTKAKNFWMKKMLKATRKDGLWKLENLKL